MLLAILIPSLLVLILLALVLFAHLVFRIKPVPHDRSPADDGIAFEEVRFPTRNERKLYGWWIPSTRKPVAGAPTLILVHGWHRNVGRMVTYIRHLHPQGYNLLAFDARQHGSSDTDGNSSVYKFAQDIQSALRFLVSRGVDRRQIGLLGLSLGGAASILAAAWEEDLRCVVSVGAPAHPGDIIRHDMQNRHIPSFPLVWFMLRYFEWILGVRLDEIAPVNVISRSNAFHLIIHGEEDVTVPASHGERLAQAAGDRGTFWLLPGRGHSDCHRSDGFWPRLETWLEHVFFEELKSEG